MERHRKRDGRRATECRPPHGHVSYRLSGASTSFSCTHTQGSRTEVAHRYAATIDDILEEEEHYADQLKEYLFYTDAVR